MNRRRLVSKYARQLTAAKAVEDKVTEDASSNVSSIQAIYSVIWLSAIKKQVVTDDPYRASLPDDYKDPTVKYEPKQGRGASQHRVKLQNKQGRNATKLNREELPEFQKKTREGKAESPRGFRETKSTGDSKEEANQHIPEPNEEETKQAPVSTELSKEETEAKH